MSFHSLSQWLPCHIQLASYPGLPTQLSSLPWKKGWGWPRSKHYVMSVIAYIRYNVKEGTDNARSTNDDFLWPQVVFKVKTATEKWSWRLYYTHLSVISTDSHFKSTAGLAQPYLVLQSHADRLELLKLCFLMAEARVSLDSLLSWAIRHTNYTVASVTRTQCC